MLGLRKPTHWQHVSPTGAIADFREVFRNAGPRRWKLLVASFVLAGVIFWPLTSESWRRLPDKPQVTYINSWRLDRTKAEAEAFRKNNEKLVEAKRAAEARAEEESKELYRSLGRATGMDVDKIEREAKAAKAAEEARKAQEAKAAVAPR
jgi:hypothetical protein